MATSDDAGLATEAPSVTVAFHSEFLGAGVADTPIYARSREPHCPLTA